MNKNDFIAELKAERFEALAESIVDGVPEIFQGDAPTFLEFQQATAQLVDVQPKNVCIVGSARFGYSLSPDTFGIDFSDSSDVDIVVVDERKFDQIWWLISDWAFPWPNRTWSREQTKWCRKKVNACFNGWLEPTEFRIPRNGMLVAPQPLRNVRVTWFNAMKELSNFHGVAGHDCHVRLYRTWEHVLRYQVWSLRQICRTVTH